MSFVKGFPPPAFPVNDEYTPVASSGFEFDNVQRNLALAKMGIQAPRAIKTGTTIVACVFKDGVVLGCDSRATAGNIVMDKWCLKLHKITDHMSACGAGTAADLDKVADMLSANMRLYELNTGRMAPVQTCAMRAKQHLFKHQGYVGAYLIIGGVDALGPSIINASAHGSVRRGPFQADGSGSLAAISVLERDFKLGMSASEAKDLIQRALETGMHADQASGNSLQMAIITKEGTEYTGTIVPSFAKRPDQNDLVYKFAPGATKVLFDKELKFDVVETMEVDTS